MLCYHKEYFALGLVSTLFIVAILHLFEEVILGWIWKVRDFLMFREKTKKNDFLME